MKRQPLLVLALAAAGAAAVVVGHYCAPAHPPRWDEIAPGPAPDIVVLRSLAKRQIAREAGAGDRSLVEAAALFGQLNRHPPAMPPLDHPALRARTEEERLCRQVIFHAGLAGPDWPESAAKAAAARLEAELQEELARNGTVRLPDPAGLPAAADLLDLARARLTEAQRRTLLSARDGGPFQD